MSLMDTLPTTARPGVFTTEVVENRAVCQEHFRLTLRAPGFPDALPGQFVQVQCGVPDILPPPGSLGGSAAVGERLAGVARGRPFVRRPFSIAGLGRDGSACRIDLMYRVIGTATVWMAGLRPGQCVSVIGPLGRPFSVVHGAALHILVGGGVGLPPMIWLARLMDGEGRRAVAVCGARGRSLLPLSLEVGASAAGGLSAVTTYRAAEFGSLPVIVTTDDGSCGLRGTAVDGLKAALQHTGVRAADAVIYACGPEKMLRAVASLAISDGIACQVCMERMMACGMGRCQSCVIRIRDAASPVGWRYRLCCSDGPVFDAREVVW